MAPEHLGYGDKLQAGLINLKPSAQLYISYLTTRNPALPKLIYCRCPLWPGSCTPRRNVGVLTASTLECDGIWKEGFYRSNQLKMKSLSGP